MCKLTDKQEIFCHEYLIDFNAKQAAIRAGYSAPSAAVTGCRNANNSLISERIEELIEQRRRRIEVSADYVLQRLIEIDKLDIADILDNQGNALAIEDWNLAWRKSVSSIELSEVKSTGAIVKKIRMPDKLKNLELIGKHINVSAFREKMEVSATDGRELVINVTSPQTKTNIKQMKRKLGEKK